MAESKYAWEPIPYSSQIPFILSGQPQNLVQEVLYHGGRGFGKSECLVAAYLQHVGNGWGVSWTGVILRREIKSLKDLIKKSMRIVRAAFPDAVFNKSERSWTFKTGEKLFFDFCKNLDDYEEKLHGQEFQFIGFDELTTWPDDKVYEAMRSLLRHAYTPNKKQPLPPPLQIRATTNPYGKGKGWVKDKFIDVTPVGVPTFYKGYMHRMHIYGSVYENKYIVENDPKYIDWLEGLADPVVKAAWLYGDWHSVDYSAIFGGMWSDYLEIEPFDIPANWKVNRSFDHGTSSPFAVLWHAEANGEEVVLKDGSTFCPPAGSLIVVAEDYGTPVDDKGNQIKRNEGLHLSGREIARRILKKEEALKKGILKNCNIRPGPGDNSIIRDERVNQAEMPSTRREMEAEGVKWEAPHKTGGSRTESAQLMIERLSATRAQDPERPHIYFFKTCRFCLKFLPEMHRDDNEPDTVAKGPDDHIWDALAYRLTQGKKRVMKSFTQSVTGRRY